MSSATPLRATISACKTGLRSSPRHTRRYLSSQCLYKAGTSSPSSRQQRSNNSVSSRRFQTTDAAAAAPVSPKIAAIVDQISSLTLLETADLVASLKTRLNIPDISFAAPTAAPGAGGAAAAAAAAETEEEAAPVAQEKTLFTLKLQSFEATAKPKIIKEVKSMLGLSLVDSKKFVESVPKVMKEGVPKEEAEKIVASLKALGGVVAMD